MMNKFYFNLRKIHETITVWYGYKSRSFYKKTYYPFILKFQNIQYKKIPVIRGRPIFVNKGVCTFGDNLVFNSSFRSNPIGLAKRCSIYVEKNGKLSINDNSGFSGVSIYCANEIIIGKNLFCGGNVSIWDTDFHSLDYILRKEHDEETVISLPIIIGDDVFIGANTIILKGVTIGDRSVIGAGSLVTKNIPPDEIWAGNPAKFIKINDTINSRK